MDVKIDWLSFTIPIYASNGDLGEFASSVLGGIYQAIGVECFDAIFKQKWDERKGGRAPYQYSHNIGKSGIVVFSSPKRNDVLIELSGKGCDFIRDLGLQQKLLESVKERVSRIDLAADMETDTLPIEFAPRKQYAATRSFSELRSKTGQTVYIGSMASERYTRVYRYAPPHPRHKYLRVEHVFRRKVARSVAQKILDDGEKAVADWASHKANFIHKSWVYGNREISLKTYSKNQLDAGKTIQWLKTQVRPAFRRLIEEGEIENPREFLMRVFLLPSEI